MTCEIASGLRAHGLKSRSVQAGDHAPAAIEQREVGDNRALVATFISILARAIATPGFSSRTSANRTGT